MINILNKFYYFWIIINIINSNHGIKKLSKKNPELSKKYLKNKVKGYMLKYLSKYKKNVLKYKRNKVCKKNKKSNVKELRKIIREEISSYYDKSSSDIKNKGVNEEETIEKDIWGKFKGDKDKGIKKENGDKDAKNILKEDDMKNKEKDNMNNKKEDEKKENKEEDKKENKKEDEMKEKDEDNKDNSKKIDQKENKAEDEERIKELNKNKKREAILNKLKDRLRNHENNKQVNKDKPNKEWVDLDENKQNSILTRMFDRQNSSYKENNFHKKVNINIHHTVNHYNIYNNKDQDDIINSMYGNKDKQVEKPEPKATNVEDESKKEEEILNSMFSKNKTESKKIPQKSEEKTTNNEDIKNMEENEDDILKNMFPNHIKEYDINPDKSISHNLDKLDSAKSHAEELNKHNIELAKLHNKLKKTKIKNYQKLLKKYNVIVDTYNKKKILHCPKLDPIFEIKQKIKKRNCLKWSFIGMRLGNLFAQSFWKLSKFRHKSSILKLKCIIDRIYKKKAKHYKLLKLKRKCFTNGLIRQYERSFLNIKLGNIYDFKELRNNKRVDMKKYIKSLKSISN